MSPRRLFRIIACVLLLGLLWLKVAQGWHDWSAGRIILSAILSAALIFAVIAQIMRFDGNSRKLRDEVPKKPLGLDS